MELGKKRIQFPDADQAQAYITNLKTGVETVAGETTAYAVIDDRTLDEARAERVAYIQQQAKALQDTYTQTYDQVQARAATAFTAIAAAATNDAVDAVAF
jgi:hypothetical protein